MTAVATRELQWIAGFGTPHIHDHPNRILPGQGNRQDHIDCLSAYECLIPMLLSDSHDENRPVLWHPDLHASNIFVQPVEEGKMLAAISLSVSSIIDWQGTWIGPAFLQMKVPPLYRMDGVPPGRQSPVLPDTIGLSDSEKERVKMVHQRRLQHKLFEASAFPIQIWEMPAREERACPDDWAQVTWKYGLTPFRCVYNNRLFVDGSDVDHPGWLC